MSEPLHGAVELAPDLEMEQRRQAAAEWFAAHIQPVARELEPRDYQFDIWATTAHDREAGHTRELLAMATGLGKTLVAAVDNVKYRQECEQAQPPMQPRTLYVSHLREINEQAERAFRLVMPDAEMQHINPAKAGELARV